MIVYSQCRKINDHNNSEDISDNNENCNIRKDADSLFGARQADNVIKVEKFKHELISTDEYTYRLYIDDG